MWTNIRLIIVLAVFRYAKCYGNNTTKLELVSTTERLLNDTRKLNIRFIDWQSVTVPVETVYSNHHSDLPKPTSAVANVTLKNISPQTWTPVKISTLPRVPYTTSTSAASATESNTTNVLCKNYRNPENPFHVEEMADIWQIVYYKMPGKLQCFKIHIRKVSDDERISHHIRYGTFNTKVNWTNISLEVRAMTHVNRKHFLQGTDEDNGVMMNVVIIEDKQHLRYVFHEESPDQWLVYQNLLLMRDCETGGVVVFSKAPRVPLQQELVDALRGFGEDFRDGKLACDEENNVMKYYEEEDKELEHF